MKKNKLCVLILFVFITSITSCTEPYALQTNTFEDILVIESCITNELKTQEVKLSRTYTLEQLKPDLETGATVFVSDNLGNRFDFSETNGKYFSTVAFQAIEGVDYSLNVRTEEGNIYKSNTQKLTTSSTIESINTTIDLKNGQTGVQISVNTNDPNNLSKYYRYTYEETSKVTVPKWNAFNIFLSPNGPFIDGKYKRLDFVLRDGESKTCYTTKNSSDLILNNTLAQSDDRVNNFPVRFISDKDYTIAERYSINIKQYIQNAESYTFYNTLRKLSSTGSLLAQFQPGLLIGNIKSQTNPNEKVLGLFEVSSVSEKRIFFNFNDVFGSQSLPSYFDECLEKEYESNDFKPSSVDGDPKEGIVLRGAIAAKRELYYRGEGNIIFMVNPFCGDCRTFSSNIKPIFWID